MNKKWLIIIGILLFSLSCNFITQGLNLVPTSTPVPTETRVPTKTPSPTDTPTPTKTPFPAPAYIPTGCQNSALATLPAATTIAEPTASFGSNPSITGAEQLKIFENLVSVVSKVYLYPDFNGLDWPGTVTSYRTKVKSGLQTEEFYKDMEELISSLNDDHSSFESPAQVAVSNADLAGKNDFVGIGVVVEPFINTGHITILSVFPDSPAAHSGLQPHDNLMAVDGISLFENKTPHEERIRGPECSLARITVQSPGGEPYDIVVVRYKILSSLPIDARLVKTTDGSRIGYIYIPTFFDETIPAQVKKALQDFGKLDGLILDNRMNSGGSSIVLIPVLSYFTSGNVGTFVSRTSNRSFKITANPVNNSQTVPLVVLVGDGTVSFGEVFSGILQDQGRAKIVGNTTQGNVETLHGYDFEDGSRVWLAQERFDPAHSHANWEKTGIIPDVTAFAAWDTFTFGNDPSVAAALTLLGHK